MSLKLYEENDIQAIADGIRSLTGNTSSYKVSEMNSKLSDYWGDFSPIANSVDENGEPYNNGLGYKLGYRANSSGVEKEEANAIVTGFIPISVGDRIRISFLGSTATFYNVIMYTANHVILDVIGHNGYRSINFIEMKTESSVSYIRFSALGANTAENAEKIYMKIIHKDGDT